MYFICGPWQFLFAECSPDKPNSCTTTSSTFLSGLPRIALPGVLHHSVLSMYKSHAMTKSHNFLASYTSHSVEILELALKWAAAQLPRESQDSPKLHIGSATRSPPLITGGVPKHNAMCFLWEKGLIAFRVVVSMGIETRRERTVQNAL